MDDQDEYLNYLLQQNALRWGETLPDGEKALEMNADIMKVVAPELYKVWMEDLENTLMDLYEHNLIEVEYDEDLTAKFKITNDVLGEFEKRGFYYNEDNGV